MNAEKVEPIHVLELSCRAALAGQDALAIALQEIAGRLGRSQGGVDGFDPDQPREESRIIGERRAKRLGLAGYR